MAKFHNPEERADYMLKLRDALKGTQEQIDGTNQVSEYLITTLSAYAKGREDVTFKEIVDALSNVRNALIDQT